MKILQPLHSSVAQGASETRNELYKRHGRVSIAAGGAAMRRKSSAHPATLSDAMTVRGL